MFREKQAPKESIKGKKRKRKTGLTFSPDA